MHSLGNFGVLSYSLAALGYLVLSGLLLVSWQGHRRGIALIAAVFTTACWAALLALQLWIEHLSLLVAFIAEVAQDAVWILALVILASGVIGKRIKTMAVIVVAGSILAAPVAVLLERLSLVYIDPVLLFSRTQLATSLVGLILIEQIFRNSTHTGRQAIKYFAIAIGVIFAYDLFLYSQAELLRELAVETWNARGILIAALVPLIALSAQRMKDWSLDVFVSRHVVFYSATFLVVGAYLVVMAMGGYYVREFGGAWGRVGQVVFFVGAGVALAGLLASGSLRRHTTVFLSKHFYRNKYDYRIEWLRFIQTLSSTDEGDVRRTAVRAIAQIFSSPGGILFLRDENSGDFHPSAAWPQPLESVAQVGHVPAAADLVQFLERTKWIIDLHEFRATPDVYSNIALPQWLQETSDLRIVSPLLQQNDVVGFICLYDPPPPFELTFEDRDLLKTVGRHVATHIAQDEASRKLAESRQFEAYNRLTAFMMHDLKNSVAQLRLIVENSARHKNNPEFIDDAIDTIGNAVNRMSKLIEQLRGGNATERPQVVDLAELAAKAIQRCQGRSPAPTLKASGAVEVRADAERLTTVIEHIIRNAQDATPEHGSIDVSVESRSGAAVLSVEDTGAGMDVDFLRDRLFRPFDSTKGSKGMGIGAYQAREYIRQLGGTLDVRSAPRQGTTFSFSLPSVAQAGVSRPPAVATDSKE
jgi:putative PEP-CTERM system histidine kinase